MLRVKTPKWFSPKCKWGIQNDVLIVAHKNHPPMLLDMKRGIWQEIEFTNAPQA